jgi:hypothetical protein
MTILSLIQVNMLLFTVVLANACTYRLILVLILLIAATLYAAQQFLVS